PVDAVRCLLALALSLGLGLPAPRPSISISPSEVIALGGAVTIRCQCRCGARRLFLYKGGIEIRELDAAGDGGEFTIPRARREDPSSWSDPSDIVWIVVTHYSKPSISLCPSGGGGVALGGNITIQCQATQRNMRFLLYKVGSSTTLQDAEPARDLAEFPISNVSRRDAGRYRCYYHTKSDLPIWLHPCSQPHPQPASSEPGSALRPGPSRGDARLGSRDGYPGMRFLLYKAGDGNYLTYTDPVGYVAEFPITSARREHSGSYTCRSTYRTGPAAYSEPSDPVQIIVAGEGPNPAPQLPAPHPARPRGISLSPGARSQPPKDGYGEEGNLGLAGAKFPIPKVTRADRGSYTCYYPPDSDPDTWSEPSDPVKLVVAGEGPGSASPLPTPGPAEGTPGRGAGIQSVEGSPARGEKQPLEIQEPGTQHGSPGPQRAPPPL
uniref:Ig-like domain-containing protein n=1 Tax=Terrapene triunguis TaxID=2587831 RepID=A0A674JUP5_9SAUR